MIRLFTLPFQQFLQSHKPKRSAMNNAQATRRTPNHSQADVSSHIEFNFGLINQVLARKVISMGEAFRLGDQFEQIQNATGSGENLKAWLKTKFSQQNASAFKALLETSIANSNDDSYKKCLTPWLESL